MEKTEAHAGWESTEAHTGSKSLVDPFASEELHQLLATVGTCAWRLKNQLLQPGSDRPREELSRDELRRACRDLKTIDNALAQAGIAIIDHTGADYDISVAWRVLAFQPTPHHAKAKVIETVKPTIYTAKTWIQMGEVIVGIPQKSPQGTEVAKAETTAAPIAESPSNLQAAGPASENSVQTQEPLKEPQ